MSGSDKVVNLSISWEDLILAFLIHEINCMPHFFGIQNGHARTVGTIFQIGRVMIPIYKCEDNCANPR